MPQPSAIFISNNCNTTTPAEMAQQYPQEDPLHPVRQPTTTFSGAIMEDQLLPRSAPTSQPQVMRGEAADYYNIVSTPTAPPAATYSAPSIQPAAGFATAVISQPPPQPASAPAIKPAVASGLATITPANGSANASQPLSKKMLKPGMSKYKKPTPPQRLGMYNTPPPFKDTYYYYQTLPNGGDPSGRPAPACIHGPGLGISGSLAKPGSQHGSAAGTVGVVGGTIGAAEIMAEGSGLLNSLGGGGSGLLGGTSAGGSVSAGAGSLATIGTVAGVAGLGIGASALAGKLSDSSEVVHSAPIIQTSTSQHSVNAAHNSRNTHGSISSTHYGSLGAVGASVAGYKPVPVPQYSPFSTHGSFGAGSAAVAGGAAALYAANHSHSHSNGNGSIKETGILGYSNAGASASSTSLAHHNMYHQSSLTQSQTKIHSSSTTSVNGIHTTSGLAMEDHRHQAPSRGTLRRIWNRLREDEREQIGHFEEWAQIHGMCRHCFHPESCVAEAPRAHYKDGLERWDSTGSGRFGGHAHNHSHGNGRRRRSLSIFGVGIGSNAGKRSGSSSGSSDDGRWSDNTRRRRKEMRRAERLKKKHSETNLAQKGLIAGGLFAVGKAFGMGSSSETQTQKITSSSSITKVTSTRGGMSKQSSSKNSGAVFYDPGYNPDGSANYNPRYYTDSSELHSKKIRRKSSFIGGIFGTNKKGDTSPSSSPSSSDDSALAYGSSPLSRSSHGKGGFWFRRRSTVKGKGKAKSSSSSDGLAYGEIYSGSPTSPPPRKSWDSYSQKSQKSLASSVSSAITGAFSKKTQRSSWDQYGIDRSSSASPTKQQQSASVSRQSSWYGNAMGATGAAIIGTAAASAIASSSRDALTQNVTGVQQVRRTGSQSSGWFGGPSGPSRPPSSSSGGSSGWFEQGNNEKVKHQHRKKRTSVFSKSKANGHRRSASSSGSSNTGSGSESGGSRKKKAAKAKGGWGLFSWGKTSSSEKKEKKDRKTKSATYVTRDGDVMKNGRIIPIDGKRKSESQVS
jgi:hypothetical protein